MDALGNPLRFLVTGGQRHDSTQAKALVANLEFQRVIADRAYDSEAFLEYIQKQKADAVIPPRSNRKGRRAYDRHLCI